jgi:uncharacterized membrane protein
MKTSIISFLVTLVCFVAIDAVWLKIMGPRVYVVEIGQLMRDKPSIPPAVIFYLVYAAGLVLFAVSPGRAAGSLFTAAWLGAALGLCAYGTYNLTNLAILKDYTTRIAMIDLAWGTVASGGAAALSAWIIGLMQR